MSLHGDKTASTPSLPLIVARVLLVAFGYALAGRLGMSVASVADYVTLIWLPAGIALAALMRWGMGMWVGVALGALGLELSMGSSLPFAAGVTVGKTLGPMAAAWWLEKMGMRRLLDRRIDVVLLMTAAPAAMTIPASVGVLCLLVDGVIAGWEAAAHTWLTWWLGDIVGILVIGPVLLGAGSGCCDRAVERPAEFYGWVFLAGGSLVGVLMTPASLSALIGLLFLPVPFVVWAGMRFGVTVCSGWVLAVTLVSVLVTNSGYGPFYEYGVPEGLMMLWAYLGTLATVGLVITALQAEQLAAERRLQRSGSLQELLVKLATGFVHVPADKLDEAVEEALAAVGRLTNVDRAYVFRYDMAARTMTNTHEWCAPGVTAEIGNLQNLSNNLFPGWAESHGRGEIVEVANVAALPLESLLREVLESQSIRTLITVPMIANDVLVGYVGFDDVRSPREWKDHERDLLRVLAQMLANVEARRQFEERLRESEKRLRTIGDNVPDGAVFRMVQYPGGRMEIPYISAGIARILGYTAEEVMAQPALIPDSIHEEDRDILRHASDEAVRTLAPFDFEIRHRIRDGKVKWVHIRSTPFRMEGEAVMADGVAMDITDRKNADEAVRQSEFLLRSVGNNLPDAALFQVEKSPEGNVRFTYVSQGIERVLETPVEEFLEGRTYISTLLPPDERQRYHEDATRSVNEMKVFEGVYRRTRQNGAIQWVEIRALNRMADGGRIMAEGVVSDVTARKRAEDALRENEAKLRSYIEHAPMGVLVIDREGRYVDANVIGQLMLGSTLEQMRDLHVWDFVAEQSHEAGREMFDRMVRGEEVRGELVLRRSDGSEFWARSHAVALDYGYYLSYVEDISAERRAEQERERMEAELRQAQKMEAIGRLAGGVAHDFNNMLQVILSHVDILLMDAQETPRMHEDLEQIQKAAQRSTDLVRQLLAFSRKQIIAPRILNLNEQIQERSSMLRRLIGPQITVTVVPGDELWRVRMDGAQVDQILTNLIVNARDAIPRKGTITIVTENRVMGGNEVARREGMRSGEYVRLAVRDTGEGMDAETVRRVFEPFFTTKRHGEGTGLGLATVYGIVKQNDGYVDVTSEPGAGTEVEIFLPRYVGGEEEGPGGDQESREATGNETVMIVEDEESILSAAGRILNNRGYTVLEAVSAREALRFAVEFPGPIHLLLTDVVMPDMNGKDLREMVGGLRPGIKVLFMSGYSADVISAGSELAPSVSFVQKPFTLEELTRKVREVLDT